jgi:hypothetical protein
MDSLSPVLTVLSAMITPVVLISACAALVTSTSNRANRVVDRLHDWSTKFEALAEAASETETEAARERTAVIDEQ